MKLIDKYFILRAGKEIIINNERMVMGSVESPYLAKLYYAFESKYYLAFVVEYCSPPILGTAPEESCSTICASCVASTKS